MEKKLIQLENFEERKIEFPHMRSNAPKVNVEASFFVNKIPSRQHLRKFLQNKMKLYCPPLREMNKQFFTDILEEKKFLIPQKQVIRINKIPVFKEFNAKNLWGNLNQDYPFHDVFKYFPTYKNNVIPNKAYLMNVVNTICPHIIRETIQNIQKQTKGQEFIQISSHFQQCLQQYQPVQKFKKGSIGYILKIDHPECFQCQQPLRTYQKQKQFQCGKHYGHAKCVTQFKESLESAVFDCPLHCQNGQISHDMLPDLDQ